MEPHCHNNATEIAVLKNTTANTNARLESIETKLDKQGEKIIELSQRLLLVGMLGGAMGSVGAPALQLLMGFVGK
jgi:hypothetical protein